MEYVQIAKKAKEYLYLDCDHLTVFKTNEKLIWERKEREKKERDIPVSNFKVLEYMDGNKIGLSRLTVNVSNVCNLGCSYCYAAQGNYGLKNSLLSSDEIIDYLTFSLTHFQFDYLMFFGGEPSLNYDGILDACVFLEQLKNQGSIDELPRMGIVSNFYGKRKEFDRFLILCKRYDISLTASIDGPKKIHDSNRVTKSGKGSFDTIKENMLRAIELGLNVGIQCTYTPKHIETGFSVKDLILFFYNEFGLKITHIVPASPSTEWNSIEATEAIIDSFCDATRYVLNKIDNKDELSFSLAEGIIDVITKKEKVTNYCPCAAMHELTIGPNGVIYPCFMFIGNKKFELGKANEYNWLTESGKRVIEDILNTNKDANPLCINCWARNFCSGCIGGDYLVSSDIHCKTNCPLIKALISEVLVRSSELAEGKQLGWWGNAHRVSHFLTKNHGFSGVQLI